MKQNDPIWKRAPSQTWTTNCFEPEFRELNTPLQRAEFSLRNPTLCKEVTKVGDVKSFLPYCPWSGGVWVSALIPWLLLRGHPGATHRYHPVMTYLEVKLGSALPQCCCCLSEMFCGSKRENATASVEQPRVVPQSGLRRDGGQDGGVGRRNPGATQPASGSKPVKGFWKLMGMTPLLQAPCLCPGDPQRGVTYFPLLRSCDVTWSDPKSLLWSGVKSQLPAVTARPGSALWIPQTRIWPRPSRWPWLAS